MNDYFIYFDESNKLEQVKNKKYMFFGALGLEAPTQKKMNEDLSDILGKFPNSNSELHFQKYKNDFQAKKYFQVLDYVLDSDISFNVIFLVTQDISSLLNLYTISMNELKSMFYIKIPERLFYGLTRFLNKKKVYSTQIVIDESTEYTKILMDKKIREQLNAHSAYRNLKFYIPENSVKSMQSEQNLFLQVTDCLLGMTAHIIENNYLEQTNVANIKNELIYNLLRSNLMNFQSKIKLFLWDKDSNELAKIPLSEYIAKFYEHKTNFDRKESIRLQKIMNNNPNRDEVFYRKELAYSTALTNLAKGYIAEINGANRIELLRK